MWERNRLQSDFFKGFRKALLLLRVWLLFRSKEISDAPFELSWDWCLGVGPLTRVFASIARIRAIYYKQKELSKQDEWKKWRSPDRRIDRHIFKRTSSNWFLILLAESNRSHFKFCRSEVSENLHHCRRRDLQCWLAYSSIQSHHFGKEQSDDSKGIANPPFHQ